MAEINLQNLDCYYETFTISISDVLIKNIEIMIEYLQCCNDNIKIKKQSYKKYTIKKGINVINHVFNIILYYTKNLEITCNYSRKAIIYYIEFIGQIENEMQTFLQLNSKDASLFVFKKTIYEISNDKKKNYKSNTDDEYAYSCIHNSTNLFSNLVFDYIQKYDKLDLKDLELKLYKIFNNIISLSTKTCYKNDLDVIMYFFDHMICINNENKYTLIELLSKKMLKHKLTKEQLASKLHSEYFYEILDKEFTNTKIIHYLFN